MWSIATEASMKEDDGSYVKVNLSTEFHGGEGALDKHLAEGADSVNKFFDRLDEEPEPELEAVLGTSHAGCGGIHGTPFVTTGNITPAAGVDFPNGFATLRQGEPLLPNNQPRIIFIISED